MHYATIKEHDTANGTGVRVTLFVSGCTHHCKGCFNPEAWDFNYGEPFTAVEEKKILQLLEPWYIRGLSVLGGEPFEPENQKCLVNFLETVKNAYPEKTIWCYTGYDLEKDLLTGRVGDWLIIERILNCHDVLVDGQFVIELKDPNLRFRGSAKQRINDVKKTLGSDEIILCEDNQ